MKAGFAKYAASKKKQEKPNDSVAPALLFAGGSKVSGAMMQRLMNLYIAAVGEGEARRSVIKHLKGRARETDTAVKIFKGENPWGSRWEAFNGGKGGKVVLTAPSEGILAHELGHARSIGRLGPGKLPYLLARGYAPAIGAGYATLKGYQGAFLDDPKMALTGAAVASASMVPMVADEMIASGIGSKLLKDADPGYKRGLKALSSWRGVPTYLAAALAPFAAYGLAKKWGAFDKKPTKQKKSLDKMLKKSSEDKDHPMAKMKSRPHKETPPHLGPQVPWSYPGYGRNRPE
jgi:hypothetical protein